MKETDFNLTIKHWGYRCFAIGLLYFCFLVSALAQETVLLSSGEWPPYQSEHLANEGVGTQIVREVFGLEGIEVKTKFYPWKRSFMMAKHGVVDGTFFWHTSKKRKQHFYISAPILQNQFVFFHLKSFHFDWNTINDLKNVSIGGTIGYYYGEKLFNREHLKIINIERSRLSIFNFKKLFRNRIQTVIMDCRSGYAILNKNYSRKAASLVTHHPKPFETFQQHLLLSKYIERNKNLIKRFNHGLERLKKSGKLQFYIDQMK